MIELLLASAIQFHSQTAITESSKNSLKRGSNTLIAQDFSIAKPNSDHMYPSGVNDFDKYYYKYNPVSPYPILYLYRYFRDVDQRVVEPGTYQAVISEDEKNLYLYQSGERKGTFTINKIEVQKYPYAKNSATYYHTHPFAKIEVKYKHLKTQSLIKIDDE